jgi:hypothetical protein
MPQKAKPRGAPFKKGGDDPRAWKHGQVNKPAVHLRKSFRDILVEIGGEKLAADVEGIRIKKTKLEWLGQKLWSLALGGDMAAVRELLDRMMGKPAQPLTGDEEGAAPIRVVLERIVTTARPRDNGSIA